MSNTKTNMLKVVHKTNVWLPQTQTWMYNQVRYLPDDIECFILCDRTINLDQFVLPRIKSLKQNQYRLGSYWDKALIKLRGRPYLGAYISLTRGIGVRVLHSHFGHQGWIDIPIAKRINSKHVTTFYGLDVNYLPTQAPIWRKRYQELFSKGDLFLCEGSHMASSLGKMGCPREKLRVHHLGIEVARIPFKTRSYPSEGPLKVLIGAAFTEKKGIPYAIKALGKVQKIVPVQLTIIGDAKADPQGQLEKHKIMKALDKAGLMSKTALLGYQPHKRFLEEAYNHHLFFSPSVTATNGDTEGGAPVSIIEMAASGMPVVSTTHCDIPEVLHYGENGWLAQERDVDGVVKVIENWLNQTKRWPELLYRARRHIDSEYDAVKQGQRLGDIYKQVLTNDQL